MPPPPPESFTATIQSARSGERDAINGLFERFYPTVRRIVHRSLATDLRLDRPWLEAVFSTGDIVQDVFVSVLRDLDSFTGSTEGQFVNYLVTITRNRLFDAVRFHEAVRRDQRRSNGDMQDAEHGARETDPAELATIADEVARYCEALAGFTERERLLLRERIEHGATYAEIAQGLGYPSAEAARKAFYAAQARLVTRLRTRSQDA